MKSGGNESLIEVVWDDEAKGWGATREDIPGLATEAESVETLIDTLHSMMPDLLEPADAVLKQAGLPKAF